MYHGDRDPVQRESGMKVDSGGVAKENGNRAKANKLLTNDA